MSASKAGKQANAGSFKKNDKRINKSGAKSKEQVEFTVASRRAFFEEGEAGDKFKLIVAKVYEKALVGIPWAVEMVVDRILGKVTLPIENKDGERQVIIIQKYKENKDGQAVSSNPT